MGNCEYCGEFDCDIDHEAEEAFSDWGDNSEFDTGYGGECS